MRFLKLLFLIFLTTVVSTTYAQSYKEHRGDVHFSRFNYPKAVELYLQVMVSEPNNQFVMRKLGESYRHLNNDTASVNWYRKLVATGKHEANDLYNYSIVLKNKGDYDTAGDVLAEYATLKAQEKYLLSSEFAKGLLKDSLRFKVTLVEQSSEFADFSPAYFGDKIIFASARQGTNLLTREYERDGEAFLQLYIADTLTGGQLDSVMPFDSKLNTRYHEGPVSFCAADSTMYFTRNNYKILKGISTKGEVNLNIYKSKFTYNEWLKEIDTFMDSLGINVELDNDDWRSAKEFQYNNKEYSTGHPTLTPDGTIIYFASNRPGGKGGTDIYKCARIGANEWSEPVNIEEINTEGNEMFPFIHESGVLFFASDGLPGLGGLDIFKAEPNGDFFEKPVNMGAPLNSIEDDFGLIADKETKTGYFSSNRIGGKGKDDLYHVVFNNQVMGVLAGNVYEKDTYVSLPQATVKVTEIESGESKTIQSNKQGFYSCEVDLTKTYTIECQKGRYLPFKPKKLVLADLKRKDDAVIYDIDLDYYGIYGSVFLKGSNEKVPEVAISCIPKDGTDTLRISSDTLGNFRIVLARNTDYDLGFTKTDFFALKAEYSTKGKQTGWVNVNEFIELVIEEIELNKTIEIPNIYYDLGKWNIRDDAAIELEKVVEFMNDNPTIVIELGSHTDARGSATSNQSLSQKRAESAVNWIVDRGINADRISAKGYGETKIKNRCVDGVKCSEAEHQENRRTEIRITSF